MTISANASLGGLNMPVHTDVPEIETENLPWRDNAVFCWWDLDQDIYGQIHVSTSLNGGGRRARCTTLVGDRFFEIVEELEPGTFNSDSITVDLDGSLAVDHPQLRLRLTAAPFYEPLDWGKIRALPPLRPHLVLNHFQGGFSYDGEVALGGGEPRAFSGTGYRDRTWGFRDETAQWVEYFFLGSVFEDFVLALWKALGADGQYRQFGWRITEAGQEPVEDFRVIRDASANMDSVIVQIGGQELIVDQVPKANRFNGWWLPMGGRQDGPAFCEYNEFAKLKSSNGQRGGAAIAHGILRRIH